MLQNLDYDIKIFSCFLRRTGWGDLHDRLYEVLLHWKIRAQQDPVVSILRNFVILMYF